MLHATDAQLGGQNRSMQRGGHMPGTRDSAPAESEDSRCARGRPRRVRMEVGFRWSLGATELADGDARGRNRGLTAGYRARLGIRGGSFKFPQENSEEVPLTQSVW